MHNHPYTISMQTTEGWKDIGVCYGPLTPAGELLAAHRVERLKRDVGQRDKSAPTIHNGSVQEILSCQCYWACADPHPANPLTVPPSAGCASVRPAVTSTQLRRTNLPTGDAVGSVYRVPQRDGDQLGLMVVLAKLAAIVVAFAFLWWIGGMA